jgi:MtN3 and saliva related transmembrane protein
MITGISLMEIYAINLVVHGTGGAFLATNTLSFFAVLAMIILILKYRDKEKNNSMEGK